MSTVDSCCVCYDPKLDELIYRTKFTLSKLSTEVVKKLAYGFSCDKKAEDKIKELTHYLDVLEKENQVVVLGGEPCLDCDKLQKLAEKVRLATYNCDLNSRKDLTVDSTGVSSWISSNPYCVSREKWEKIAYTICREFKLQIKTVEETCDFTFEVVGNIIPCDIVMAISVYEQMCDLKFKVNRDEIQCKIDFDILVNETNCNIDFKTYKKLIDCNLSFDVLKTIYENDCGIEIEGQSLSLVTPMSVYPLKDLDFKGVPNLNILKKLNVNTSKSKYLKEPQAFINKLKQDYKNGR